jgi:DNA-binding LacI/PurR family transcriptional regulator
VNIKEIAKKTNVSVATVSRFLDPDKRSLVHPKTREKLEKTIRAYQYIPNRAARALSKRSSETIGMVTPFSADIVRSPYFEGLIAGIIEGIKPYHYDLKWIMIGYDEGKQCNLEELLQKHAVDGLVFLSWRLLPKLVSEIEKKARIPAVLINDYDSKVRCSIIYCDNGVGIQELCSHFRHRQYKQIGIIRGPETISPDAQKRYRAFKNFSKHEGYTLNKNFIFKSEQFSENEGYRIMKQAIQSHALPNAIFCANDDLAWGALEAVLEDKLEMPKDIAIAGFDDSKKKTLRGFGLTSVAQPLEAMGQAAIKTLMKLISGQAKGPIQLKFEPKLIVRDST